jgi:enoyl-CoA hydratase
MPWPWGLFCCADVRIGAEGPFKITANEVAIGLTMPHSAVVICQQRLSPAHFHRAVVTAEVYSPQGAMQAGFLDRVVAEPELLPVAQQTAAALSQLDMAAYAATKLRVRESTFRALREAIQADDIELGGPG